MTDYNFKLAHDHSRWKHNHNYAFGHELESVRRTFWVMLLTASMTIIEIGAGWFYHSIAVFADDW